MSLRPPDPRDVEQPPTRSAEVPARRFAGWVERFRMGHGGELRMVVDGPGRPELRAADGAVATLDLPFPPDAGWPGLAGLLAHVDEVADSHPYALLLLRRGGWGVARCAGEQVVTSRVGTRYVQGRTKKGGSSQQRYARRRGNQADAVVSAVVDAAPGVWGAAPTRRPWTLVTGGDRLLVADAVALLTLRVRIAVAPRRLDVPDPRRAVLDRAAQAACAVRVQVHDPVGRDW